jgi:hypothetical protein
MATEQTDMPDQTHLNAWPLPPLNHALNLPQMIGTYIAIVLSVLVTLPLQAQALEQTVAQLGQQLHRPVPGGVAVVPVLDLTDSPTPPVVTLNAQRVLVIKGDRSWWAIVGIALDTEPGEHALVVSATSTTPQPSTVTLTVEPYNYKSQHITLKNRAMVSPPPQTLKRIKRELNEQLAAYATFSDFAPSNLIFEAPVSGRLSSPFGLRRYFNGKPRHPHSGLDFAAPTGTPVKSPADGRILMIGDLYFNGLTVFIDHGQGVISMFCHLSGINHLPGDVVKRGDVVGVVGSTGRSTGPHLHWNVSLNGARVDPALFLRR